MSAKSQDAKGSVTVFATVARFVTLTLQTVKAAKVGENIRAEMVTALTGAFFTLYDALSPEAGKGSGAGSSCAMLDGIASDEVNAFTKDYLRQVRKALRAEYPEKVQEEAAKLDLGALAWGQGSAPANELASRLRIVTVRGSEAKTILTGYLSGNVAACEFLTNADATVTATEVLASVRAESKGKGKSSDASEGSEDGETEPDAFNLSAAIATVIQSARKRGVTDTDIATAFAQALTPVAK